MRWAEKDRKKILVPNSVHTRPKLENSKKNSKKIQKMKKVYSGIIFSQNAKRLAEKVRKKFYSRISFIIEPSKKFRKRYKKNEKIKNPLSGIIFSQNGMR